MDVALQRFPHKMIVPFLKAALRGWFGFHLLSTMTQRKKWLKLIVLGFDLIGWVSLSYF